MAGLFVCPYCGAATQVSAEFAGMSGPCANCSKIITVPAGGEAGKRPRKGPSGDRSTRVLAMVAVAVLLLFVGLGYAGKLLADMLRARMLQEECSGQLHKIWSAMDNYFNDYSAYPPAVVRDKNGKPMHSWRVLLLPYLGQREEQLYKEYHFDEPWDGPNNRELAESMPLAYGCPCDPEAFISSHTSYLAVLDGATGDFATEPENPDVNRPPPKGGAAKKPITPYLVVEAAESGICWLEPRDLTLRSPPAAKKASAAKPGAPQAPYPRSLHLDAVNVLASDGGEQALTEAEVQAAFGPPD